MEDEEPSLSREQIEADVAARSGEILTYVAGVTDVVEDTEQYEAAMAEIIRVKETRKKADAFFKKLLQPMVKALNEMRALVADAMKPIEEKEDRLNRAIVTYADRLEREAEAQKRQLELEQAQALKDAMEADEPVMPDDMPPPIILPDHPALVKTGTHTGGLTKIPKWRFAKHPEICSDVAGDIYLDDPRCEGIDRRLFKFDRGRVTTWNKSKTPMDGIEHYYGKTTAVNERRS